jgi:hypothetical protein
VVGLRPQGLFSPHSPMELGVGLLRSAFGGNSMLSHAVRILVVGLVSLRLGPLLARLAHEGWGSYVVQSIAEARTVFRTLQFDLVLAAERLSDGTGFELAQEVGRRSASLFVEVGMSGGHVWLPVLERGTRTMGQSALDLTDLEWDVRQVFSGAPVRDPVGKSVREMTYGAIRWSGPVSPIGPYVGANRVMLGEGVNTIRKSKGKAST